MQKYSDENLFELINDTFSYMPLACILNDYFFIIHAGIEYGSDKTIEKIIKLQRPIKSYSNSLIADIMWSDPTEAPKLNGVENPRGVGHYFCEITVNQFLKKNKLEILIRGHQCTNGMFTMHKGKTLTLFSSSGYHNNNSGSALLISEKQILDIYKFSPIEYPKNDEVYYYNPKPKVPKPILTSFALLPKINPLKPCSKRVV